VGREVGLMARVLWAFGMGMTVGSRRATLKR
jgi:hypothetical protein